MGENVKTAGENAKYYQIVAGEIVRKVDKDTEGAVERVNKKGNTVYELEIGSLTGRLISVDVEDSDFGKQLKITLDDIGLRMVLSAPVKSGYADSFLYRLNNIKKHDYITIKAYDFEDKDKKRRVGMSIFSNNEKVANYYTKENPNGMPAFPKERTERNITVWDLDKTEFLLLELAHWNKQEVKGATESDEVSGDDSDGLPF